MFVFVFIVYLTQIDELLNVDIFLFSYILIKKNFDFDTIASSIISNLVTIYPNFATIISSVIHNSESVNFPFPHYIFIL